MYLSDLLQNIYLGGRIYFEYFFEMGSPELRCLEFRFWICISWLLSNSFVPENASRNFFFLSGISFTDSGDSQDIRGKEGTNFYSTLPLLPAHKYSDIYLQLCIWDDYLSRIFNRNACVYQAATWWDLPPYWIAIWLIDGAMFVCLLHNLILGFCYSSLTGEIGGFELASTITLVFQANRLNKCASHPKWILFFW